MCLTTNNGYRVKGKEVKINDINPEDIPQAIKNELEQTPASQLDILYLRRSSHVNAGLIDALTVNVQNINNKLDTMIEAFDKQLRVTVVNGKKQERPITELIAELWEMHHDERDQSIVKTFIYKHRKKIYFFFAGFLVINVLFRTQMHQAVDFFAEYFLTIIKWIF